MGAVFVRRVPLAKTVTSVHLDLLVLLYVSCRVYSLLFIDLFY